MPDRLEKQARFLDENDSFGLIGAWANQIDGDGRPIRYPICLPAQAEEVPVFLLFRNYFVQSAVMLRKEAVPLGGYRDLEPVEDFDMWVRISRDWGVWNLPTALTEYRIHGGNISLARASKVERIAQSIIRNQLNMLGVHPSNEEFKIHWMLGSRSEGSGPEHIRLVESWLRKLMSANVESGAFVPSVFDSVIRYFWVEALEMVRSGTPMGYMRALASSLSSGSRRKIVSSLMK
jgi:hypothetical protein